MKGPASEKQKDFLEELGYRGDLSKLTKAQASLIIDKLVAAREAAQNPPSPQRSLLAPIALVLLLVLAAGGFAWYTGWLAVHVAVADIFPAPPPAPPAPAEPEPEPVVEPEIAPPAEPPAEPAPAAEEPLPEPLADPASAENSEPETPAEPVLPPLLSFSDLTGTFQIEARIKSLTNGVVTLEKADGTVVKVPREKLSAESNQQIDEFIRRRR